MRELGIGVLKVLPGAHPEVTTLKMTLLPYKKQIPSALTTVGLSKSLNLIPTPASCAMRRASCSAYPLTADFAKMSSAGFSMCWDRIGTGI